MYCEKGTLYRRVYFHGKILSWVATVLYHFLGVLTRYSEIILSGFMEMAVMRALGLYTSRRQS